MLRRRFVLHDEFIPRAAPPAETGANAIEYLMIVALIAVAAIVAVAKIGGPVSDRFSIPGDSASTTSATVLGETESKKDCAGRDHAHKGCR